MREGDGLGSGAEWHHRRRSPPDVALTPSLLHRETNILAERVIPVTSNLEMREDCILKRKEKIGILVEDIYKGRVTRCACVNCEE